MKNIVLLFGCVFVCGFAAAGQKPSVTAETYFATDPKPNAIRLPLPVYPTSAAKVGLNGLVIVNITVDEHGIVIAAADAGGPGPVCPSVNDPNVVAVRTAAVTAARAAKFEPPMLDGKVVLAAGVLRYDFESHVAAKFEGLTLTGTDEVSKPGAPPLFPAAVLTGKAIALPKPRYPAAARAVRATGAVQVQVVIGEDGNLYSAEAVSGHPLLRSAAEIAACGSTFSPTLLSGKPVRVSGIITYNFVP